MCYWALLCGVWQCIDVLYVFVVNQMAKASLEIAKLSLEDVLYIDDEGDR